MKQAVLLSVLFIAVFVGLTVSRLPLSLVVERVPLGLGYDRIEGSIWNGDIYGLKVEGKPVGEAAVGLKFLPLLTGRISTHVDILGPGIDAEGDVSLRGDRLVAEDATATIQLAPWDLGDIFGQRLRGGAEVELERLVISPEGCEEASFRVATDALRWSMGVYGTEALELEGEGRCEGRDLFVPLRGGGEEGTIEATLRVEPQGRYVTLVTLVPSSDQFDQFLESAGFQRQGEAFLIAREGQVELGL
jgi:hypothetical protein